MTALLALILALQPAPDSLARPDSLVAAPATSAPSALAGWRRALRGVSVSAGVSAPLAGRRDSVSFAPGQTQGETVAAPSVTATLTVRPARGWFASVTALRYLRPSQQAPWDPDFTYAVGYDDWRPGTVSLTYANYGGNRFAPDGALGERVTHVDRGTLSLGWKDMAPEWLARRVRLHPSGGLSYRLGYDLTPEYYDRDADGYRAAKHRLGVSARYVIVGRWYVDLALHAYPVPGQQQPWDPDLTYGVGRFDWRSNRVSVQYANYSGTRYPWRAREAGTGRLRDGAVSFVWQAAF